MICAMTQSKNAGLNAKPSMDINAVADYSYEFWVIQLYKKTIVNDVTVKAQLGL